MIAARRSMGALGIAALLAPAAAAAQGEPDLRELPEPARPGLVYCPMGLHPRLEPDGTATCVRPTSPPPPPPPAPAPSPPPPGPAATVWDPRREPRWIVEFAANGTGGITRGHAMAGGSVAVGPRRISIFDGKPPIDLRSFEGSILALFTACLLCVPRDVWIGNERGFDVRGRLLEDREPNGRWRRRAAVGIAPGFRITKAESRTRFPAVIGVLLPEIGASLPEGRAPEVYLRPAAFPFAYLVAPHFALEIEPAILVAIPVDRSRVQTWLTFSLGFVAR